MYTNEDYPITMKNLQEHERLKAIDILNAMLTDGYDEENAIPISISQAKKWVKDATSEDLAQLREKDLVKHEKKSNASRLQDADVVLYFDHSKEMWAVESVGAIKVNSYHKTKREAKKAAEKIVENRNSKLIIKTKKDTK